MQRKLSSADRKVIDLLQDGGANVDRSQVRAFIEHSDLNLATHVDAVQRIFDMLGLLPVVEPSDDLASRTLERISDAAANAVALDPLANALASQQRH